MRKPCRPAPRRRFQRAVALFVVGALASVVGLASGASGQSGSRDQLSAGHQSLVGIWPIGNDTLWVFTQNQTALQGGGQSVELTTDGGKSWANVTPPGLSVTGGTRWINGTFPLSATKAWVVYGGVESNPQTLLYTGDAGRLWTKVGILPVEGCVPQFVDPRNGTCTGYGGAAGSMALEIYRTWNGGASWRTIYDGIGEQRSGRSAPGSLPFGCDKQIQFTSVMQGWALFICNGGFASLFETTDGGATWIDRPVTPPPAPPRYGSEFSGTLVLRGSRGAVAFTEGDESLVYVTDDGGDSFTPVYPPEKARQWYVDVVTPLQWRLAYRDTLLGTNNGGKSWFAVTDDATQPIAREPYAPNAPDVTFANNRQGWLTWGEDNGPLMRTTDGGREWKPVEIPGT